MNKNLKITIGFLVLFTLYHFAEYFVLFKYNPTAFLLIQATFFIAAGLIAKWQGFNGISAWGLGFNNQWLRQLAVGIMMGVFLYGSMFLVSIGLKSEEVVMIPSVGSMISSITLFWFGNLFSSFSEDILTRGYIYKHFNLKISNIWLVFISALIYLLNHIYRLNGGWLTWGYLFALGVLFIIPVILTRRLWLTGGMHWFGNTTFYFTHNVIETKEGASALPPNLILLGCILLFIPFTAIVIRMSRLFRLRILTDAVA